MIDDTMLEAEEKMEKAVEVAKEGFAGIRTGRAHPGMFQKILVDYYGAPTPLQQLASFQNPEARTLLVTPYDKIALKRTAVGDRYVLEEMRASGCNVGGEQSGHIILTDHATTGDGLVAGLQVLAALVEEGKPASEVLNQFEPVPQLLKNVRFNGGEPLGTKSVQDRIAAAQAELGNHGRLVIRKSGTEPLIRVMAEGRDRAAVERIVDEICAAVAAA